MESIRIIKNFITSDEQAVLVNYTDYLEQAVNEKFAIYQDGKRLALQFGNDSAYPETSWLTLDLIREKEPMIRELFTRVIQATKSSFEVAAELDLYVCSFWFAKQYPGATVKKHDDSDEGHNKHFTYSAVLYLNSLEDSGDLEFLSYNYSHRPAAGDLVIFPSQGTGMHQVSKISETRYSLPFWITTDQKLEL